MGLHLSKLLRGYWVGNKQIKKVVMIGLGYIGLPTASIIASRGVDVIGVDVNPAVVETINSGRVHIVEPDLDTIVRSVVSIGKLKAQQEPETADVFIIAVPTPLKSGNKPDISYVEAAAKSIAEYLKSGDLIILESTSPVGTTEHISKLLKDIRSDLTFPHESTQPDISISYCPERVLPGRVLYELIDNDRIIGGVTSNCAKNAKQLYKLFLRGKCILTSARTAEMCKLVENAYRDVNIAFANELSMICEDLNINSWELIKLANHHPRVNILQPGCGVGGHCIAVDPWFIVHSSPKKAKLIKTSRVVNDSKPKFILEKIKKSAKRFKNPVIACLGITFKADIDDFRESPALEIVRNLAHSKIGRILVVDPYVTRLPPIIEKYSNIELANCNEVVRSADVLTVLVDHSEFKNKIDRLCEGKVLIDARGITT